MCVFYCNPGSRYVRLRITAGSAGRSESGNSHDLVSEGLRHARSITHAGIRILNHGGNENNTREFSGKGSGTADPRDAVSSLFPIGLTHYNNSLPYFSLGPTRSFKGLRTREGTGRPPGRPRRRSAESPESTVRLDSMIRFRSTAVAAPILRPGSCP